MDAASIQKFCHGLPGTTEDLKWGCDIVFSVGKKMYAVIGIPEGEPMSLAFKTTEDIFRQLIQQEGIDPAPYLARHHWVRLSHLGALDGEMLESFLRDSYRLVFSRLPKKTRAAIERSQMA